MVPPPAARAARGHGTARAQILQICLSFGGGEKFQLRSQQSHKFSRCWIILLSPSIVLAQSKTSSCKLSFFTEQAALLSHETTASTCSRA